MDMDADLDDAVGQHVRGLRGARQLGAVAAIERRWPPSHMAAHLAEMWGIGKMAAIRSLQSFRNDPTVCL